MRILFLTMYYKPDNAATGILMAELAEELALHGHDVRVITSMPHYSTNSIWPEYRGKWSKRERQGAILVHRVWSYVPVHKDRLLPRFFSYLSFTLLSASAGLLMPRPDVIVTPSPSPPLTNGISAYLLGRLRGIPFISNIQDIYPDVAIRMGVMKSPAVIAAYKKLEKFVYAHSHAITVISEGFQRNLTAKGVPADKISVIPNFIDAAFVSPHPRRNDFSAEQGWDDKFVVLFAGNVGMSQGLDTVLEAAGLLRDTPDLVFAIVGNGASKPALIAQVAAMGLSNVQFLPYQSYDHVPILYSSADVGLIPLRRGFSNDSVPSKLFTIMGVARPVIASVDAHSETAEVIDESKCGVCIEPEDPKALAAAIISVFSDSKRAEEMGRRGRQYVEAHYTRTSVAHQYEAIFSRLLSDSDPVQAMNKPGAARL
ncbi:MAG: glycosyltransferase family 4 protein [Janthinobacterium lividum]